MACAHPASARRRFRGAAGKAPLNVHRSVWTLILIFVACFAIYRVSPRGQLYDSRYTLAVASQLAAHGRPDLDALSAALVGQQATPAVAAASDYRLAIPKKWLYGD